MVETFMTDQLLNFAGKVALVTGGSSGIGRATALLFARQGAKVVIGDISEQGSAVVAAIKETGGDGLFVQTDVTRSDQVRALIKATVEKFGRLDCAFNNAGVLPEAGLLAEIDEESFDRTIAVDLKGVFLCMKYEIEHMLKSGGGAIVNTASVAGVIADPGIAAYVAAKHGVIGLSKAAAIEYASRRIRINALAPGLVETAMTKAWLEDSFIRGRFLANTPMGRTAKSEEMAGMVLFLCSDLASFAAGQTFVIDGGYTAH
jgi:NAD(P)-dependent dehydrogenase (short-subunit alcohol dehydrogenase family)